MTIEETKQQILIGLNNNTIQILIQKLSESIIEIEKLNAEIEGKKEI
jgi:hypothetical protein